MILTGRMPRLARLPSSRALALDLGISRATVVHVYEQLASEGYIEGRHGAGMFVSSALPEQVLQVGVAQPGTAVRPLDAHQRAIYVGSFSKVLLPTLRLGFVVLPARLLAPA
jgi:GntR family transcriptional regulator / MocR family aminotransferase